MANFLTVSERPVVPAYYDTSGMAVPVGSLLGATMLTRDWDATYVWRTQPSVRKVTDFIAGNVASIPLHVYAYTDEGRERVRDGALAKLITSPSHGREETPYLFWKRFILDWLLYERAILYIDEVDGKLIRIPPGRWLPRVNGFGLISKIVVINDKGESVTFDPERFIILAGYSGPSFAGVSPVETLQQLLEETSDALSFRQSMWRRQASHTGVVEREQKWANAQARENFLQGLRAFDANSHRSGGTLLLDEAMKWKDRKPAFTPSDLDDIEARQLTDVEVASLYHIAPEMLGIRQGNYSNMEAFRQALYRDNLGPYIDGWEQCIRPLVDVFGDDGMYVEVFLDAKLRGSFAEQAKSFNTLVGAPIMTRNEARSKMNLPDVEGGDELITPLNVLEGGQASPHDVDVSDLGGPEKTRRTVGVKSWQNTPQWGNKAIATIEGFLDRQRRVVESKLGAGEVDWWDQERWDRELAEDLTTIAVAASIDLGVGQAEALGTSEEYSPELTVAYLEALALGRAAYINTQTYSMLEAAAVEGTPAGEAYEKTSASRAHLLGAAFIAAVASWTAREVAKQTMTTVGYKTWRVTSGNPRDTHAAQDGVTVRIDEAFPNGLNWPGDPVMGAEEVANCMCGVELNWFL